MRPLDPTEPLGQVGSIRFKLVLLVGLSILASAWTVLLGRIAGVPIWISLPVTSAVALLVTQWLARGLIGPLTAMTDAARRMAAGDYSARVAASSADEVGQLARSFDAMAGELARTDQRRRDLVATVSHELRTPLAAQRAVLENLVDGVTAPDPAVLEGALAQSERLSALVEDLLDLSRVDGGAVPLRLEQARVADLLEAAIAEARVQARSVDLTTSVTPVDLVATVDRGRIAQVLSNLLDNAIRHSPADGTVRLVATTDPTSGTWTLECRDSGPGIPADRRADAFRRFGAGPTGGGGSGLGLSIAAWVAELHGGTIRALDPESGEPGARLAMQLPLDPPDRTTTNTPATQSTQGNSMTTTTPTPAAGRPTPATGTEAPQPPGPAAGGGAAPPVSPLAGLWPERDNGPQIVLVAGSVVVGLVGALILPFRDIGIGTLLILLSAGGLMLWASRRRDPWTIACAALAVALGSLIVLRANEGVSVLSVASAGALAAVTATGARRFLGMVGSGAAWVLSGIRGLPLLGRTLGSISRHNSLWRVVRTVVLSLLALVVFGGLFASADALLGTVAERLIPDLGWDSLTFRAFTFVFVGGITLAGCYLALNPPRIDEAIPEPKRRASPSEWAVPLGVVLASFTAFLVAQGVSLFGGHDYVQRTTGLTYAEYVHQGFGQLTVATALMLVVVALVRRKASTESARDRSVLAGMLVALCVLTLCVVASALRRMALYQEAYGYTVLRLWVDGFELWLGIIVLGVLVTVVRPALKGHLPRFALITGAVFTLGYGLLNPDAFVATQNIARYEQTGKLDGYYLRSLGADAVPTVAAERPAQGAAGLHRRRNADRRAGGRPGLRLELGSGPGPRVPRRRCHRGRGAARQLHPAGQLSAALGSSRVRPVRPVPVGLLGRLAAALVAGREHLGQRPVDTDRGGPR